MYVRVVTGFVLFPYNSSNQTLCIWNTKSNFFSKRFYFMETHFINFSYTWNKVEELVRIVQKFSRFRNLNRLTSNLSIRRVSPIEETKHIQCRYDWSCAVVDNNKNLTADEELGAREVDNVFLLQTYNELIFKTISHSTYYLLLQMFRVALKR